MSAPNRVGPVEAFGRPIGKPAGVYVTTLAEQRKVILLCFRCEHRFGNPKPRLYYKDMRLGPAKSKCDDCRSFTIVSVFIPEEYLVGPDGQAKAGLSCAPL